MDTQLSARVREVLDAGGGEVVDAGGGEVVDAGGGEVVDAGGGERRFLPLVTLESGARVGLDASAAWLLVPDDGGAPRAYAPEQGHGFFEVLESKRDDFDASIEAAARAAGLPAEEIAFAFPATGIVRAVLARSVPYMTRLALQWLRLTELREVRTEIVAVSRDPMMPAPVRDLAVRLTVPE